MPDAAHLFSSDLRLGATGDLAIAEGAEEATQRVLRRLLTNLRDYLWQPGYGAGLPSYVGRTLDEAELAALIRAQMYLERGVARDPEPVVTLRPIAGGVSAQIQYTAADTGLPATLGFDLTPDNG